MKSRQPSIDSMTLFGMTSIDLVNMISGRKMLRVGEPTGDGERWKFGSTDRGGGSRETLSSSLGGDR